MSDKGNGPGPIKPALTAEEWASRVRFGTDDAILPMKRARLAEYSNEDGNWNGLTLKGEAGIVCVNPPDMHAIAALALYGQPFGFTRKDVKALRHLGWPAYEGIADRIEALLPPEIP